MLRRLVVHLAAIRYRLLIVNLVVVAVPIAGIFFARLHERQLLAALERDLIDQAALVRAAIAAAPDANWSLALADAGVTSGATIEVLNQRGNVAVVGRAPVDRSALREVKAALAGRYGAATRVTADRRRIELSVAIARWGPDGQVAGAVRVTRSTAPVMTQLVALRHLLFDVLLIAIGLTVAVSLFLAATIARPLARLTRGAERIAAGDRSARLALARKDEIGQLSRAVDRMAAELDRRAREAGDLAADISHELKTPLTAIRGATELLRDGAAADPEARDRFLDMILTDAARLDRLVSRLLELARLEADDAPPSPTDVAALVRDVAARDADLPGAAPLVVVADAPAVVPARADAVAAAVHNLVTNARQHAAAGTAVTITVDVGVGASASARARVRVTVHNHGAPISPAVQAKLWRRFFTTRGGRGGSGLGLAIVRAVAGGHGGSVGVTSDAAAGTRFWLELPRA